MIGSISNVVGSSGRFCGESDREMAGEVKLVIVGSSDCFRRDSRREMGDVVAPISRDSCGGESG